MENITRVRLIAEGIIANIPVLSIREYIVYAKKKTEADPRRREVPLKRSVGCIPIDRAVPFTSADLLSSAARAPGPMTMLVGNCIDEKLLSHHVSVRPFIRLFVPDLPSLRWLLLLTPRWTAHWL